MERNFSGTFNGLKMVKWRLSWRSVRTTCARVVRRSYPAAHEWLQRASDAGSADARAMLGKMKVNGWGEAPDVQGGLGLVRQAAVAGSTAAKAYLGSLYESGAKVGGKDPQMAMQLYREGIAAGDTYCMALLGNMYLAGDGIEKDSAASRQFLEVCALGRRMGRSVPRRRHFAWVLWSP
jgi:TPR repeat protein